MLSVEVKSLRVKRGIARYDDRNHTQTHLSNEKEMPGDAMPSKSCNPLDGRQR